MEARRGLPLFRPPITSAWLAAPTLAFLEITSVKVRGKDRPERIYALLGAEDVERSDDFARLSGAHARLLAALATADAAAARSALAECRDLGGATLSRLYDNFERQLSEAMPATISA